MALAIPPSPDRRRRAPGGRRLPGRGGRAGEKAFVGGVTAAASGGIAGACFVLARRAIVDVPTLLIGLVALGIIWRFKVPEPVLIGAGAAAGLIIFALSA